MALGVESRELLHCQQQRSIGNCREKRLRPTSERGFEPSQAPHSASKDSKCARFDDVRKLRLPHLTPGSGNPAEISKAHGTSWHRATSGLPINLPANCLKPASLAMLKPSRNMLMLTCANFAGLSRLWFKPPKTELNRRTAALQLSAQRIPTRLIGGHYAHPPPRVSSVSTIAQNTLRQCYVCL